MGFVSYFDIAMRNETNTENWYQVWAHCIDKPDHEVLALCNWLMEGTWKSLDIKLERYYNAISRKK